MHVKRLTYTALLLTAASTLAACGLFVGGEEPTPTPTPTLIAPVEVPPTDTPLPPPTDTPEPSPTPTEAPTATPTQGSSSHQVERGEWIYAIARVYGVNPQAIIAANPGVQTNPDLIFPNQQLVIPSEEGQAVPTAIPTSTPVAGPTAGPPSLPLVDRSVYEGLLTESLPPVNSAECSTAIDTFFVETWNLPNVGPRLGCPTGAAMPITGTWMEFGPGSRVIWLRELGEFHAITSFGFGQRWVFPDNSGLEDAAPLVSPVGSNTGYTPTSGRMAWLLDAHPEIKSVYSPAFGDENVIEGTYQEFENGALMFDGALIFVFYEDQGPWWYAPVLQPPATPSPEPTEETPEPSDGDGNGSETEPNGNG